MVAECRFLLVAACEHSVAACGIEFLPETDPQTPCIGSELRVSATGPPGKRPPESDSKDPKGVKKE